MYRSIYKSVSTTRDYIKCLPSIRSATAHPDSECKACLVAAPVLQWYKPLSYTASHSQAVLFYALASGFTLTISLSWMFSILMTALLMIVLQQYGMFDAHPWSTSCLCTGLGHREWGTHIVNRILASGFQIWPLFSFTLSGCSSPHAGVRRTSSPRLYKSFCFPFLGDVIAPTS